jgi:predicted nucleic acid-binding protein
VLSAALPAGESASAAAVPYLLSVVGADTRARQVFLRAAQIRAATRLRTPDALHLAFASYGKCDVLLTGDAQMGQKWQPSSLGFTYPAQVVVI